MCCASACTRACLHSELLLLLLLLLRLCLLDPCMLAAAGWQPCLLCAACALRVAELLCSCSKCAQTLAWWTTC